MPETASEWRVVLAHEIASQYPAEIILLVGSAATGLADAWSDLDFVMYWHTAPSLALRQKIAEALGGQQLKLANTTNDEADTALHSWSDIYTIGEPELKIDITHKTIESLKQLIADIIVHHQVDLLKLAIINGISDSMVLVGADLFAEFRTQIGQLPQVLTEQLLQHYLHNKAYDLIDMIVRREDMLFARHLIDKVCENTLFALIVLNQIYPPEKPKHLSALVSQLVIKPKNLVQRIHAICSLAPAEALPLARTLLLDTFDLAEAANYDVFDARQQFAGTRQALHNPIYLNKDRTSNA